MTTDLSTQIQDLITKTQQGKIEWQQLNANNIRWTRQIDGKVYYVTLQTLPTGLVVAGRQSNQYVFTIQATTGEMILQLQSNQSVNPVFSNLFSQLMNIVGERTKNMSTIILSKLLDKL